MTKKQLVQKELSEDQKLMQELHTVSLQRVRHVRRGHMDFDLDERGHLKVGDFASPYITVRLAGKVG